MLPASGVPGGPSAMRGAGASPSAVMGPLGFAPPLASHRPSEPAAETAPRH